MEQVGLWLSPAAMLDSQGMASQTVKGTSVARRRLEMDSGSNLPETRQVPGQRFPGPGRTASSRRGPATGQPGTPPAAALRRHPCAHGVVLGSGAAPPSGCCVLAAWDTTRTRYGVSVCASSSVVCRALQSFLGTVPVAPTRPPCHALLYRPRPALLAKLPRVSGNPSHCSSLPWLLGTRSRAGSLSLPETTGSGSRRRALPSQ